MLHKPIVGYFFLPTLPTMEYPILGPFFFDQKSLIFNFLAISFFGSNIHNAVGKINKLTIFELAIDDVKSAKKNEVLHPLFASIMD